MLQMAENKVNINLLKQFFQFIPQAVALFDTKMVYLAVNSRWLKDYKLEEHNLIGKSHYEIFPDVPPHWKELHQRCLNGETLNVDADPFPRDDGTTEYIKWVIQPWYSDEDEADIGGMIMYTNVITEQVEKDQAHRDAQQSLRQERDLFSQITETSPIGIMITSNTGQINFANKRAEDILGLSPDEANERSYNAPEWQITDFEGNPFPENQLPFAQVLETKESVFNIEHAVLRPDGQRTLLSVNGAPLYDDDGNIHRAVFTVQDITDRKHVEHELQTSLTRYESVISAMAEGIVMHDATGQIITSNKRAEEILGLTYDQMRGKTSLDPQWRSIHEDGSPFPGETHPAIVTLQTGKAQHNVIMGVHKPDDTLSWISINSEPLINPDETQPFAVVASFNDITERVLATEKVIQNEQRFRGIFELSPVGIALDDGEGNIIEANPAMCELLGYTADELIGRNFRDITAPEYVEEEEQLLIQLVAKDIPSYQMEKQYITKQGNKVWAHLTVTGYIDDTNTPQFFVGIIEDISERRQAEDSRLETERLQIELSKEIELRELKARLFSMVAHEFRTPLSVIMSSTELLRMYHEKMKQEQRFDRLDRITEQVKRLNNLLEDVSFINKNDLNAHNLQLTHVNLPVLLQQIIDEVVIAYQTVIPMVLESDADCETFILDELLIHQIFINLLGNAVKYAKNDGTDRITLYLSCDTQQIMMKVVDKGIGIPEADQARMFETFHRATNVGTTHGTGLGLAIVKRAVEALNGSVEFESIHNVGTTFTIIVPIIT